MQCLVVPFFISTIVLMTGCFTKQDQGASPTPLPSATPCAFVEQMFPPTNEAFEEHHLSAAQRAEVLKWVAKIPASDKAFAKWMQPWAPSNGALVILDAKPISVENGQYSPWTAINTNMFVNPRTCDIGALPTEPTSYSVQPPLGPTPPSSLAFSTFHVREYHLPSAQNNVREIAEGPDGAFWFTEASPYTVHTGSTVYGNRIGRISSKGAISEFKIPTLDANPEGIVAGPDGKLWFTELIGNRIGRISINGRIDEYAIPLSPGETRGMVFEPRGRTLGPRGIAVGPDGALWFTEELGQRIGRITSAGAIREFDVPGAKGSLGYIAAGSDSLWFTINGRIGRISTGGDVSLFDAPGVGDEDHITHGPDGKMWIAEFGGRIASISATGRIKEYAIPTPGSYPGDIVVGCDGALWFSEFGPGNIGRITTNGALTEFPLHIREFYGLAPTRGCSLWFTETSDANKVGVLKLPKKR